VDKLTPIYCPLCTRSLCISEKPTAPSLYFGCGECGVLFKVIIIDPDLSEALELMQAGTNINARG
jgi:hypothetical protein